MARLCRAQTCLREDTRVLYTFTRNMLLIAATILSMNTAAAAAQPTAQQFHQWLTWYTHNDPRADFNLNGGLDSGDFNSFLKYHAEPEPRYGWTPIRPSPDSLIVYVSSSEGNDANDGRSQSRPVKTILRAYEIVRENKPDWVCLKRGDTFFETLPNWKKSGRSEAEPMIITAYGTSTARPKLMTGNERGLRATGPEIREHLYIIGLEFQPHTRGRGDAPGGLEFICDFNNILIEDCKITGYADNLQFQAPEGEVGENVRVRRSVIADSWAVGQHSQGLYAARVDGILLEGNVFDHNGWNTAVSGADPTIFNHNIYIQTNCENLTVRQNIISNASSHGLQARPGGNIIGNLFYRNSISILFGNEDVYTTGVIDGNVILEGKDISPDLERGMGIHVQKTDQAKIRNNVILRNGSETGLSEAIAIIGGSGQRTKNLTIEDNTIYNWRNNFVIENEAITNIIFRDNVVYDSNDESPAVRHWFDSTVDKVTATGNTYYIAGTNSWFRKQNTYYNLSQWMNVANETNPVGIGGRTFVDSTRTMEKYAQTLFLPANAQYVIMRARSQNRSNWDDAYSATGMVSFFKQGYQLR